MVVAGHVSPAPTVVPHHHSTVLARKEVAVGLSFVPVLIQLTVKLQKWEGVKNNNKGDLKMSTSIQELVSTHQRVTIGPSEVALNGPVVQSDPLVFPEFVSV